MQKTIEEKQLAIYKDDKPQGKFQHEKCAEVAYNRKIHRLNSKITLTYFHRSDLINSLWSNDLKILYSNILYL